MPQRRVRRKQVRRKKPAQKRQARKSPSSKSWGQYLAPHLARGVVGSMMGPMASTAWDIGRKPLANVIGGFNEGYLKNDYVRQLAHIIHGHGDYKINKNVFLNGRLPQMVNMPSGGGTIIRFQEYLGDIYSSATANTFNLQSFYINAGNVDTFPWLSQLAANYEQYSFEGLVFEFRSTSADALNSTNTALGSVMLATNYDAADSVFATKTEMLNYEFSKSIKPSESCMHMVECEPNQTVLSDLYTLQGAVPSGKDSRFYHLGLFQIATTGFQGTSVNCGELHVTYQVRLLKPKLFNAIGLDVDYAHWTQATSVAAATPLGTAGSEVVLLDNIGVSHLTSATFSLPRQYVSRRYMMWFLYGGSAAAVAAPNITYTNATSAGLAGLSQTPISGVSSVNMRFGISIDTSGNGTVPVFTVDTSGTLPSGSTTLAVYITQVTNLAA